TSGATGAAQVQFRPRVNTLELQLNYGYGCDYSGEKGFVQVLTEI
ncbi:MAG: hypothetical protein PWQ17_1623, partial [Anaerophaga sp.]|nr:hypothetical protein [Anaerophaga sp.]